MTDIMCKRERGQSADLNYSLKEVFGHIISDEILTLFYISCFYCPNKYLIQLAPMKDHLLLFSK